MKDLFSSQSSEYAKFRPMYPEVLFQHLLSHVEVKDTAWDCGTGNGQVASVLSNYFKQVYATDISKQQVEHAVKRENIFYSVQPAEHTSFSSRQFDLVTVAQAIHWFKFDEFYNEVKRTLKPGGVIAVIGYGLFQIDEQVDRILHHFYHEVIGPYWDKERRYIDEEYKTIPFPFEEIAMPSFAMSYDWTIDHVLGYLSTWSAVQHYKTVHEQDPLQLIEAELRTTWGGSVNHRIQFPLLLRVGRIG